MLRSVCSNCELRCQCPKGKDKVNFRREGHRVVVFAPCQVVTWPLEGPLPSAVKRIQLLVVYPHLPELSRLPDLVPQLESLEVRYIQARGPVLQLQLSSMSANH